MAGRIRTIKPEILENARTARLSSDAFRLFIGAVTLADDYGNLRAEPAQLHGAVFWGCEPRESVANLLGELARASLVSLYMVKGVRLAHLTGWAEHQRVDKPGHPRVPGPAMADSDESAANSRDPRETLAKVTETLAPDHDHDLDHDRRPRPGASAPATPADLTLIPTEPAAPTTADNARTVLAALNAARKAAIPKARELRPTTANLAHITARLNDGATVADCLHVIAVRKREVERGGEAQWFDAITPFRPDNFAKSEAMRVEDVRGPVKAKSFTPEPQHRPDTLRRLSDVTHRPDPEAA